MLVNLYLLKIFYIFTFSYNVIFILFNLFSIMLSISIIVAKNPMHSIFALILAFSNVIFIQLYYLQCEFLPIIFLIVYIGAVAILFLFIVMLLNIRNILLTDKFFNYLPVSLLLSIIFIIEIFFFFQTELMTNYTSLDIYYSYFDFINNIDVVSDVSLLSYLIYEEYYVIFIMASILLLIAMIGAILLTLRTLLSIKAQLIYSQVYRVVILKNYVNNSIKNNVKFFQIFFLFWEYFNDLSTFFNFNFLMFIFVIFLLGLYFILYMLVVKDKFIKKILNFMLLLRVKIIVMLLVVSLFIICFFLLNYYYYYFGSNNNLWIEVWADESDISDKLNTDISENRFYLCDGQPDQIYCMKTGLFLKFDHSVGFATIEDELIIDNANVNKDVNLWCDFAKVLIDLESILRLVTNKLTIFELIKQHEQCGYLLKYENLLRFYKTLRIFFNIHLRDLPSNDLIGTFDLLCVEIDNVVHEYNQKSFGSSKFLDLSNPRITLRIFNNYGYNLSDFYKFGEINVKFLKTMQSIEHISDCDFNEQNVGIMWSTLRNILNNNEVRGRFMLNIDNLGMVDFVRIVNIGLYFNDISSIPAHSEEVILSVNVTNDSGLTPSIALPVEQNVNNIDVHYENSSNNFTIENYDYNLLVDLNLVNQEQTLQNNIESIKGVVIDIDNDIDNSKYVDCLEYRILLECILYS